MSIAEKLTTIAENQEKVYEAGQKSEYDRFWDALQQNGTRQIYTYGFYGAGWSPENLNPKYDVVAVGNCNYMCYNHTLGDKCVDMRKMEEENGIVFDFSRGNSFQYAFSNSCFEVIGTVDLTTNTKTLTHTFSNTVNAHTLKRIERLICKETDEFGYNTFQSQQSLEYVGFEGVIGKGSLNLQWMDKLSVECMKQIISCLKNYAGTEYEGGCSVLFHNKRWDALEADSAAPDGGTWKDYVQYTLGWTV